MEGSACLGGAGGTIKLYGRLGRVALSALIGMTALGGAILTDLWAIHQRDVR